MDLDLTDPQVRRMADLNHVPEELWTNAGDLLSCHCRTCGRAWPCAVRLRLRGERRTDTKGDPDGT